MMNTEAIAGTDRQCLAGFDQYEGLDQLGVSGRQWDMVDGQYAKRRDMLKIQARGMILADPVAFGEAGKSLDEYISEEQLIEEHPHLKNATPGVRLRFRLDLVSQAAIWSEDWIGYTPMNFRGSGVPTERQRAARLVVLAIILAVDPEASKAVSVEMCSFAAVPWDGDDQSDADAWLAGRDLISWIERGWENGDDPSPRVLDLLEEAMVVVRDGTNAAVKESTSNGNRRPCDLPSKNPKNELERGLRDVVVPSPQQGVETHSEYRVRNRKRRKKRSEAERMRDESAIAIYLQCHPQTTRDLLAEAVGIPTGTVSLSQAWKRFTACKKRARNESRPVSGSDLDTFADPESAMTRSSDGGRAPKAQSMSGSNARQ